MATSIKGSIASSSSGQALDTGMEVDALRKKAQRISQSIFPLTDPIQDAQGQTIQFWSLPGAQVGGLLKRTNGTTCYIDPFRVKNALSPEDTLELPSKRMDA
jgi:hypothetical protein